MEKNNTLLTLSVVGMKTKTTQVQKYSRKKSYKKLRYKTNLQNIIIRGYIFRKKTGESGFRFEGFVERL